MEQQLDLEQVFCIACRGVYLRPVTMPCGHTLCLDCFKSMVNITAYQCPICRKRISNWLRKYKHNWDSMVNEGLWESVQKQYPIEVQKKSNDEDDGLEERIANEGFTRIVIQEGEIKKEFDNMLMILNQEHEAMELKNLEIAKILQEEENANQQARQAFNEQLIQSDTQFSSFIQEKMQNELRQERTLLKELDTKTAMKLQNQLNRSKKEGPLDKMFAKLISKNVEERYINKENNCSFSSSSSSSFTASISTNSFANSSCTNSSITSINEDSESCTCGRLQNVDCQVSPCQFCIVQMKMLDNILIQQQNDFLLAKTLEEPNKTNNFVDYNLRKKKTSSTSVLVKKIQKLSKGQLTLKQMLG